MSCCHQYFAPTEGGDTAFSVDISSITFGPGVLGDIGGVGYREEDIDALTSGVWAKQRLITNAAREVNRSDLGNIFWGAPGYW